MISTIEKCQCHTKTRMSTSVIFSTGMFSLAGVGRRVLVRKRRTLLHKTNGYDVHDRISSISNSNCFFLGQH